MYRGETLCFFAISLLLILNAFIYGSARIFAFSYGMAPDINHIFIVFSSSIISLFISYSIRQAFLISKSLAEL
jgi:hypothetical protein